MGGAGVEQKQMQRFLGLVNSLNFRPLPHFGGKTAAVLGLLQDLRKGKQGGPSQQARFVAAVMVNADAHMLPEPVGNGQRLHFL